MKSTFVRVVLLCVIVLSALLAACASVPDVKSPEQAKALKIGCIMPFTGSAAMWGQAQREVLDVYIELVNEQGGVKIGEDTYKLDVSYGDDSFMPAPAAAAARKMIYDNGVVAITGFIGMGFSAVSPITNAEKVIFIARTGSGVAYDPAKAPYVVFGLPSSEITINQAIAAMQSNPDLHVLCWTATDSAKLAAEAAMAPVDRMLERDYGIKSVRIYYPDGTTNFTPYLTKMAEQGTQVIFTGGSVLELALMAKQRWAMGYKWPLVQTACMVDPDMFMKICGSKEAAQGVISDRPVPWELKKTAVAARYVDLAKSMDKRFMEKHGKPIVHFGAFASGATNMAQYIEAAQMAGSLDPDKIMAVFRGGTIETFVGKYTLSGKKIYGSPVVFGYPCEMGQIQGDKEVYLGEYPMPDADTWYIPPDTK
jgi:ABC-type branched-subunit amino acid transport system substrate-binding protein